MPARQKNLQELDRLLKTGNIQEVQKHLDCLETSKLPREFALPYANMARRVGYHRLAFKILNPIVRPKNKFAHDAPTPQELVEYGICLFRLGVVAEARRVLSSPLAVACPEHKLYLAFTHFGHWEYQAAQVLLEQYVSAENLPGYERLIGIINLVQAYIVNGSPEKSVEVLNEVIRVSKENNYHLILGNALQTLAEAHIELRNFAEAEQVLKQIETAIGTAHYRYNIYVERNCANIELQKTGNAERLRAVLNVAKEKRLPEVMRECELLEAVATKNVKLFRRVYFGTPYPDYRKRALKKWNGPIELGNEYLWPIGPDSPTDSCFDLADGIDLVSGNRLKKGTSTHRVLLALATDIYKTLKTETLFSLLFPNEYLTITTSAHRVHDTINRARNWLKENEVKFSISERFGEYYLSSENPYNLKLTLQTAALENIHEQFFGDLKKKMGPNFFTANEVTLLFGVSPATTNRYLKEAVENEILEKTGRGRATKYRLKKAS